MAELERYGSDASHNYVNAYRLSLPAPSLNSDQPIVVGFF
jgi:hypothetical protein